MSHPAPHDDDLVVLKPQPRPRRTFDLSSDSPSEPPTPPSDPQYIPNLALDTAKGSMGDNEGGTPSRNRSFLNLTTSTLFGIYQPNGTETENPTPWGTGAQTPADVRASFDFSKMKLPESAFLPNSADGKVRRRSTVQEVRPRRQQKGFKGYFLPLAGRVTVLYATGMLYGLLLSHLHDRQKLAPVPVNVDRSKWSYLAMWGCAGALLGEALPWADVFWAPNEDEEAVEETSRDRQRKSTRSTDAWMDVVRSIGAFVGIAFAIRKLPWQSTLQLSLTLALANPAVWYLIDRSPPGFIMSTLVAITGTGVILGINPSLVPSPSPYEAMQGKINQTAIIPNPDDLVFGVFSQESVGVVTWIASVIFVSAVCFGNIGRRLAPQHA